MIRVFIDTNLLVYLFDFADGEKQREAQAFIDATGLTNQIVLSTQVLQELYATLRYKLRATITAEQARIAVERFAQYPVEIIRTTTILAGIERSEQDKISFWDALIVETALSANCSVLATEDLQHGRVFDGLRIENPFAQAG